MPHSKQERALDIFTVPTVNHDENSVMVWMRFSGGRSGYLFFKKGILKKGYLKILQVYAIPSGFNIIG